MKDGIDKTLELLRELPVELALEDVGRMVAAFPLVATPAAWLSQLNLNSILMTTAGSIIIAGSIYLLSPSEPTASVNMEAAGPVAELAVSAYPTPEPAVVFKAPPPAPKPVIKPAPTIAVAEPAPNKDPQPAKAATQPGSAMIPAPASPPTASLAVLVGNGSSKRFDLSGFTGVAVMGSMDVILEQGAFSVRAEGDPEIVQQLVVTVDGKTLKIASGKETKGVNSCQKSATVMVRMPTLDHLELTGSGDVATSAFTDLSKMAVHLRGSGDIRFASFQGLGMLSVDLGGSGDIVGEAEVSGATKIELAGSGDVHIAGRTGSLQVKVVGSGDVDASDLRTGACEVHVVGSGDVMVNCQGSFERHVTGSGDIHNAGDAGGSRSRGEGRESY